MITKQYLQVVAERQKMLSSILKNKFLFYPCFVNKGPAERSQLFNTTYCNIALGNLLNLLETCLQDVGLCNKMAKSVRHIVCDNRIVAIIRSVEMLRAFERAYKWC